jgi:hypothetical protein
MKPLLQTTDAQEERAGGILALLLFKALSAELVRSGAITADQLWSISLQARHDMRELGEDDMIVAIAEEWLDQIGPALPTFLRRSKAPDEP